MSNLERKIYCCPEYRTTVSVRFTVKGDKGAVDFCLYPCDRGKNDELPNAQVRTYGVKRHSHTPYYKEHKPSHEKCWLLGGPCYQNCSIPYAAKILLPGFLNYGENWLWEKLEDLYSDWFDAKEADDAQPFAPSISPRSNS